MREITLQELAALAENAKGEIEGFICTGRRGIITILMTTIT